MINMDMVGRMKKDSSLAVYGTGTSPIFKQVLKSHNDNFKLIYHFPIWRYESLILSKFNNRYYHFTYFPDEDIETGRIQEDVLKSSHKVVN